MASERWVIYGTGRRVRDGGLTSVTTEFQFAFNGLSPEEQAWAYLMLLRLEWHEVNAVLVCVTDRQKYPYCS